MLDQLQAFESLRESREDGETYSGKTLDERLAGRFYTPFKLADDLSQQMLRAFGTGNGSSTLSVCDPFCGDGRLIASLVRSIGASGFFNGGRLEILIQDIDAEAVDQATKNIADEAKRSGVSVDLAGRVKDTLLSKPQPRFDLIITNPPWELIKPDRRETAHMQSDEIAAYREALRQTANALDEIYPDAKGQGAWGGWATNLARCGWDYCLRSLKHGGVLGIVLPTTLMADQSSVPIRRKAFTKAVLIDVASFPSEARLFDKVDQSVASLTMRSGQGSSTARARIFDQGLQLAASVELCMSPSNLERRNFVLPLGFGASAGRVLEALEQHPTVAQREGITDSALWLGRELDETNLATKLYEGRAHPFVKGRMVHRHQISTLPSRSVRKGNLPSCHSLNLPRVVWRDVSRATQKRRMIGTIIPPGWVTGNSLHVACYRDGNLVRTRALYAFLSSLVLEAQVRSRLATGHMSLGVVRSANIPDIDRKAEQTLSRYVAELLKQPESGDSKIEILIAKSFGLSRTDFATLVECYPKLSSNEKAALTSAKSWSNV